MDNMMSIKHLFIILVPALLALLLMTTPANAADYEASPDGSPYSIEEAIDLAGPGDTIILSDGVYDEPIVTVQDGEEDNPITIVGSSAAVINGAAGDRMVLVRHSWISLEGFTVDGELSEKDSSSSYVEKCVFVWGKEDPKSVSFSGGEAKASIIGFSMDGLTVKNCG